MILLRDILRRRWKGTRRTEPIETYYSALMEAIKLVQAVSKTLWKHCHRDMRMNAFYKIEKDLVHPRELRAIIMPESQYHIVRMTAAHIRDWATEGLDSGRSELHSSSPWGLGGCRDITAFLHRIANARLRFFLYPQECCGSWSNWGEQGP